MNSEITKASCQSYRLPETPPLARLLRLHGCSYKGPQFCPSANLYALTMVSCVSSWNPPEISSARRVQHSDTNQEVHICPQRFASSVGNKIEIKPQAKE